MKRVGNGEGTHFVLIAGCRLGLSNDGRRKLHGIDGSICILRVFGSHAVGTDEGRIVATEVSRAVEKP